MSDFKDQASAAIVRIGTNKLMKGVKVGLVKLLKSYKDNFIDKNDSLPDAKKYVKQVSLGERPEITENKKELSRRGIYDISQLEMSKYEEPSQHSLKKDEDVDE